MSQTPSTSLRFIRDSVWQAIETNDAARLCLLLRDHRKVALKVIDDWNREQKANARQERRNAREAVDRDARDVAAEQCDVEIGNDPSVDGNFGDGSGDYVIEPVNTYGR